MADTTSRLESADSPAIQFLTEQLAAGLDAKAWKILLHCFGDSLMIRRVEAGSTDIHATQLAEGELQGDLVAPVLKRLRVMVDAADKPDASRAAGWIRICIDGRNWRDLYLTHEQDDDGHSDTFTFEDRQAAVEIAVRQGDYTASLALLESLSERQIPAMVELHADHLERGLGTDRDPERAHTPFEL